MWNAIPDGIALILFYGIISIACTGAQATHFCIIPFFLIPFFGVLVNNATFTPPRKPQSFPAKAEYLELSEARIKFNQLLPTLDALATTHDFQLAVILPLQGINQAVQGAESNVNSYCTLLKARLDEYVVVTP